MVLNMKLCSLAGLLGCTNRTTHAYMSKFLESSDFVDEHFDSLLLSLEPGNRLLPKRDLSIIFYSFLHM